MIIKETIRDLMSQYGLNQKEFARTVGVREESVSRWMQGKTKPHHEYDLQQWIEKLEMKNNG